MSSLSHSPPDKEEKICWTEKEALVKEEAVTIQEHVEGGAVTVKEVEEDVSVKDEEDTFRVKEEEDVTVKEEENAGFGEKEVTVTVKEDENVFLMKDEEGEITVTLEEDEEEKIGDLINTSKYREILNYCGSSGSLNNLVMLKRQRIVSPDQNTSRNTCRDPQGGELTAALTVGRDSPHQALKFIREHTQERNLISVVNVGRVLVDLES
ncbi:uncharacterized protein LOC135532751 [Oncorhynchus masou masou]|uniref:uncharacterized protein LOC135532751 n=1 Tax=Oncorhynchus masou masou TaxID=90313 RepID=UPI003183EC25